ncbi:MAG: hypothetical protein JO368_10385 [Acidimicrobiales bacterium]|nr:hypothetical protein [Acidimicrobiales bacterium]
MSELTEIIRVFGAIDDEVVADPTLTPKVAAFLPAYAHGAAGWYRASLTWLEQLRAEQKQAGRAPGTGEALIKGTTGAGGATSAAALPSVATAPPLADTLAQLSNDAVLPEDQIWGSRRVLAMTVLSRVVGDAPSDPLAPVTRKDLLDALVPLTRPDRKGIGTRSADPADSSRASELLGVLKDEHRFPGLPAFHSLLDTVRQSGLVPWAGVANPKGLKMTPAYWTVTRSPHAPGPAVAFSTHHRLHGVGIDKVKAILDPKNWERDYKPPWCHMYHVGRATGRTFGTSGDDSRYLELVADDCDLTQSLYAFETCLDFLYTDLSGGGGLLAYSRTPDQRSNGGDGGVTVDEGSLVVRPAGDAVDVVTSKRVQFRVLRGMSPLTAGMVAWMVWVLGYSSLADLFVARILKGSAAAAKATALHPLPTGDGGTGGSSGGGSRGPTSELRSVWAGTAQECRTGMRSSLKKMGSGDYKVDDYAADVSKVAAHGRRQSAALARFWTKSLLGEDEPTSSVDQPSPQKA